VAPADLALHPELTHPMSRRRRLRDVVLLVSGGCGFVITAVLASRDGIQDRDRAIFHAANDLSQLDYHAVWVPMQYGTFGTVFAVAGLALMRKRPRLAAGLLLGGTSAYALAKVSKRYVGRGRPASELEDATIRGKEEGDLGFPSGHAAVSAALTTAAAPFVSTPVRVLAAGLAAFVSFARVHVGAHLPLDVAGGVCMGVAVASAVNLALGVDDRPSA
jgi:membrane-associated phospholipid phosphatase